MSDGDTDADKAPIELKVSYVQLPREFKVLDETEEYYVIQKEGGNIGAVEKSKLRVVTISGYIT